MVLARSEGKVGNALDAELAPNRREVFAPVELYLVGNHARAILLIVAVLKVPARLRLLDPLADGLLLGTRSKVLDSAPNLQVLIGIAILVLGWALPRAEVGAARRKAKLVDVGHREGGPDVATGSVDDHDGLIGGIGEEAATGRVPTTPRVPLGLCESRDGSVGRRGIKDADGLLGPVSKLQRIRHD